MPKRIMVFNDSKDMLLLIEGILSHEGYEVVLDTYGVDEVPKIQAVSPDLTILDCPVNSEERGWEVVERLKLTPPTASIPIILCIANLKKLDDIKGQLGVKRVALLHKPYDANDLLLTIKQAFKLSDVMPNTNTESEK